MLPWDKDIYISKPKEKGLGIAPGPFLLRFSIKDYMSMIVSQDIKINKALEYVRQGYWPIRLHGVINGVCTCGKLDCKSPGKHPHTPHGHKDASQDEGVIRRWWAEAPFDNLGICPRENEVAIDVDPKNGGDGTWASWQAEFGAIEGTPTSRTGSGGFHFLFRLPPGIKVKNNANKVGPGVDLRTYGGLIVVEPSNTDKGGYSWITPLSTPLADCPQWLLDKIASTKGFHEKPKAQAESQAVTTFTWEDRPNDFPSHPGASSPGRHEELCRLIGVHLNRGDSGKTITAMALDWAARCNPPIGEKDVLKTIKGLANKEREKPGGLGSDPTIPMPAPAPTHLGVSNLSPTIPEHDLGLPKKDSTEVDKSMDGCLSFEPIVIGQAIDEANTYTCDTESVGVEHQDDWPTLHDDAYHGLAGEIVKALSPETEADPVGVLLTLLGAFGNAIGHGAYVRVGPTKHHANLFISIVGNTASRKGVGLDNVKWLMREALPEWQEKIGYGLSSGEGLIERVQDDDLDTAKTLWAIETEFVNLMLVKGREGNTLSAKLRNAWDGAPIESIIKRKGGSPPPKATKHHIGILGHITPPELNKALSGSVDLSNGFVNRFLWCQVRRARYLPDGGNIEVLRPYVEPLRLAIAKAQKIGLCERDDEAKALWHEVYRDLSDGDENTMGRAEPQALRLSLLYALLDGTQIIGERHLKAALAVWAYCEESGRRLFLGLDTPNGGGGGEQPLHIRLLDIIAKAPGVGRKQMSQTLPSRLRGGVANALAILQSQRLAHPRITPTNGRPSEGWYPGPGDDEPKPSPFTFTWGSDDEGGIVGSEPKGGEENPTPFRSQDRNQRVGDLGSDPTILTPIQDRNQRVKDLGSDPTIPTPIQDRNQRVKDLGSDPTILGETQEPGSEADSPPPSLPGVSNQEHEVQGETYTEAFGLDEFFEDLEQEPKPLAEEGSVEDFVKMLAAYGLTLDQARSPEKLTPKQQGEVRHAQEYALAQTQRRKEERERTNANAMSPEEFDAELDALVAGPPKKFGPSVEAAFLQMVKDHRPTERGNVPTPEVQAKEEPEAGGKYAVGQRVRIKGVDDPLTVVKVKCYSPTAQTYSLIHDDPEWQPPKGLNVNENYGQPRVLAMLFDIEGEEPDLGNVAVASYKRWLEGMELAKAKSGTSTIHDPDSLKEWAGLLKSYEAAYDGKPPSPAQTLAAKALVEWKSVTQ